MAMPFEPAIEALERHRKIPFCLANRVIGDSSADSGCHLPACGQWFDMGWLAGDW
eukprot:c25118_g2_i1 orf=117-281(-)